MTETRGAVARVSYRSRLAELATRTPEDPEEQAHWAKYLSVLISGYLEQSIKEILLEFTSTHGAVRLSHYIEATWPESRNMKTSNIKEILEKFEHSWGERFVAWLDLNETFKSEINSLISGRNDIAHGKEANTTNVTLRSTRTRLQIAFDVVEFLEELVLSPEPEPEPEN
ncbi:HEPN domain-containing protein [Hyphomonas sp. UBA4494]|uniref:HEPN domain-containing protein n=1 Tax=Hyphomonas sp. UBA4494 TaxID=1946631 RepID=UPI0025C0DE36|nr:HEPN domain-containing protein [Hyphomonas sp. UBA4494]